MRGDTPDLSRGPDKYKKLTGKGKIDGNPHKFKQGSDLIDLRLTWRELIFWVILEVFGDILEDFWRTFGEKIKNFRKVDKEPFWWP